MKVWWLSVYNTDLFHDYDVGDLVTTDPKLFTSAEAAIDWYVNDVYGTIKANVESWDEEQDGPLEEALKFRPEFKEVYPERFVYAGEESEGDGFFWKDTVIVSSVEVRS